MGEAKRKQASSAVGTTAAASVQPAFVAKAVRQVIEAITDFHGADCLLYASVGAHLLRSLGVDAQAVAGSAAWRIGSGDGDVISHAREIQGPRYGHADAVEAGMFHAWIAGPGILADFTTSSLRLKAELLDAADGGITTVDWSPDYLWLVGNGPHPGQVKEPNQVRMAAHAKVFCYRRHAEVERLVFDNKELREAELAQLYFGVRTAYRALCEGASIQIVGVGKDALQTEPVIKPIVPVPMTSIFR